MNPKARILLVALASSFSLGAGLSTPAIAQSAAVPAAVPAAAPAAAEEMIVLTPFQVNVSKDVGYLARNTLAGSRLNTNLRDVAAQVSIMTPEFLQDIGAVTLDDALRYSLNIENTKEFYDVLSNNNSVYTNLTQPVNNRVRGLSQASPTHDFFRTALPIDAYNSERFTFVYGPNAILFGSGNPSGSADTTLKRARTGGKAKFEIDTRFDSNDSWRVAVDVNQPIIKDKLALRVAATKMDNQETRKPNYDRQERAYATITATPYKWVTARAWFEDVHRERMPVRNTVVTDAITPWINAGKPIFDNGLGRTLPANSNISTATGYDPIFLPVTTTTSLVLLGRTAGTSPAGTMYGNNQVATRSYDTIVAAPNNFDYSLADGSLFPLDVNFLGAGLQNRQHGDIRGGTLELNPAKNWFIEAGANIERFDSEYVDLLTFGTTELRVDANRFLPDRVTPNPNVGRYYFTTNTPSAGAAYSIYRSRRISTSYEFDFAERLGRERWTKWLGRHRAAALWTGDDLSSGDQRIDFRVISDHAFTTETAATQNNNSNRVPNFRFYVDNPQDANSQGNYSVQMPFDPFAPGIIPGTDFRVASLDNPYGSSNAGLLNHQSLGGRVFTYQGFFLKDRLVLTYGKRHDTSKTYSIPSANMIRTGTGSNSGYALWYDQLNVEKQKPNAYVLDQSRAVNTDLLNVVVHPFPWLSVYYDKSNTQDPPSSVKLNLDGSPTTVGTGRGQNVGITLSLLDDNLVLRLNKFKTVQDQGISQYRAFTGIGGINAFRDAVANIERSVMIAGAPASTRFASYSNAMLSLGTPTGNSFRETYDVVSDKVSQGYEAELIANPTKNWRVSATFARTDPVETGIAGTWFDFIEDRLPVWAQYQSAPTYTGRPIGGANTVRDLVVGNAINSWNFIKTVDGRRVEQQRRDRFNFTTRYSFSQGALKGFFVGGSALWRSAATLGYGSRTATGNELSFSQGFIAPTDTLVINDLTKPIAGPALTQFDGFLGYSRRLWRNKVSWRVQLNVRNLFDDRERQPQRLTSDGTVAVFTLPENRTFILTNNFSF